MSEVSNAIKQICEEKKIDYETVVSTIELALAAAYRKDFGEKNQNIKVTFDPEAMKSKIFDVKTVVENVPEEELAEIEAAAEENKTEKPVHAHEDRFKMASTGIDGGEEKLEKRFNPKTEIQIKDAVLVKKDAVVGDEIITDLPEPSDYGRMAAQTAKQVIIQKLREVERDMIFKEFKDREREVIAGVVQRQEGRLVLVDLGKAIGCLPFEEQIVGENYNIGDRIKVYVKEVRSGHKGAEIVLSRKSEEILKKVFYLEIPEVANGLVELKNVAREAGSRSKVAIFSEAENIDPVGSCVGQRGARIQTIINELGGEKIDIIQYDEDPAKYISNALSPAKIVSIELNERDRRAIVKVSPDKLSLAIGKNGQNVRLAAKLTGWKIDIIPADSVEATPAPEAAKTETPIDKTESKVEENVKTEPTEDNLETSVPEKKTAKKKVSKVKADKEEKVKTKTKTKAKK